MTPVDVDSSEGAGRANRTDNQPSKRDGRKHTDNGVRDAE
jgi:hypothetical protein